MHYRHVSDLASGRELSWNRHGHNEWEVLWERAKENAR